MGSGSSAQEFSPVVATEALRDDDAVVGHLDSVGRTCFRIPRE